MIRRGYSNEMQSCDAQRERTNKQIYGVGFRLYALCTSATPRNVILTA